MNVESIWKPGGAFKSAIVNLESGIADVINEAFVHADPEEPAMMSDKVPAGRKRLLVEAVPGLVPGERGSAPRRAETAVERVTAHTQSRLAALASFDEARAASQKSLGVIGEALAGVLAAHHLSREFLDASYADIHRANEMEVENAIFSSETRKLMDRVEKLDKQRVRYETLVELQKRREAKLTQEMEALRDELNASRLEAVEANNLLARTESRHGELHTALAAKSAMAERLLRENEMLREKGANLALDLETTARKHAEMRRKYDDLSAIHASASGDHAEMTAKLSAAEKEAARVQKLHDRLEARLAEAGDTLRGLELELDEREKRYQSEIHAMKHENQTLNARLRASTAEHLDAVSEVAAMKTRFDSLEAEKHKVEKRFAALSLEVEEQRKQPRSIAADSGEAVLVKALTREVDALRGENARLGDKMKRLDALEKLLEASKQRARENSRDGVGLSGSKSLLRTMPDRQLRQGSGF